MEKMCNNSVVNGVTTTNNNDTISEICSQHSPKSFKSLCGMNNSVRNVTSIPSPEDDIPSFQIPRNSQRFSNITEEQDSILPISPVCTPPSIHKFEDFEEPLIHTIRSVVEKNSNSKVTSSEILLDGQLKRKSKDFQSEFDKLGMLDTDISWDSSMETPAPHSLPLDEYNTIERATLLPENDVKSMQPRALFSPYKDDDIDCTPLKYSSESDDNQGDSHSGCVQVETKEDTIILKEVKDDILTESPKKFTSDTNTLNSKEVKKDVILLQCSPVFRIKGNKKKTRAKRKRALLVKSPIIQNFAGDIENEKDCHLDFSPGLQENKMCTDNDNEEHKSCFSQQSNSIQDDSFQDLSFSFIDELCKTSSICDTSDNTDYSAITRKCTPLCEQISNISNLSLITGNTNKSKFFYEDTKKCDELYPLPSLDGFLTSAKRLEEGNMLPEKKLGDTFSKEELTVFNEFVTEVPNCEFSVNSVKRSRTENSAEKTRSIRDNKVIKLDNYGESEIVTVENANKAECDALQDISNHFDTNNSLICLTADYAESLVSNGNSFTDHVNTSNKQINTGLSTVHGVSCDQDLKEQNDDPRFPMALENTNSLLEDGFEKVDIFKEGYKENQSEFYKIEEKKIEEKNISGFQGFKTASGAAVKISEKVLSKARDIFKDLDIDDDFTEFPGVEKSGYPSAVKLQKEIIAGNILRKPESKGREEAFQSMHGEVRRTEQGFLKFKTGSNKNVEVSEASLREVKAEKGEEEIRDEFFDDSEDKFFAVPENISLCDTKPDNETVKEIPKCYGFNTASGKSLGVSSSALSEAKKLWKEIPDKLTGEIVLNSTPDCSEKLKTSKTDKTSVKQVTDEDSEDLIPSWLHAYNTSPTLSMDRLHLEAVTCYEDCQHHSTPKEQYLVKSPVLGYTDRFYNRRKRRNPGRKLVFEPSPKLEMIQKNDFKPSFNLSGGNLSAKRGSSEIDSDFKVFFKKRKVDDTEEAGKLSEEVKEKRERTRQEQLKAGRKEKVKPVKGSHILKKSEPQKSWSEVVEGAFPERHSKETLLKLGVREDVLEITYSTAAEYKFKSTDFFTLAETLSNVKGFPVGDDCSLIFDDDNMAGIEEFTRAFLASSGVQPNLISKEWVRNHYKWLIWKFSHYERAFPFIFGGRCLTPHNVLVQLKYRYDREVDLSQRSALKKILERDDSSAKKMVLCVCDIKKTSDLYGDTLETSLNKSISPYKLGLTDGWYSCYAQTDSAMTRLIEEGKVVVGTKLATQGAELVNCEKGVSPLEASDNVHLKIATNSTRRAKWDAKLGFQKNPGPLLVRLNTILPNGGIIGRVDVIVARIYPVLYMEKKSDGTHVTRNARMENKASSSYQQQQEAAVEKLYQQVRDEMRKKQEEKGKNRAKLSTKNISDVFEPEELYKFYENCSDPSSFQSLLSNKQKNILIDYQRQKEEMRSKELSDIVQQRIKAERMNSRKVSQLLRIKIVDLHKPDYLNPGVLTVWNSMEDVSKIFSEGKSISIFNTTSNTRFYKSVQLNSTRQTRYRQLSQSVEFPARKITNLSELTADYEALFNEVDIAGIVVVIREFSYGSRNSQGIFIADENYNFAGIVFWGNCKDYGWENVLTVGTIVSCSNLYWSKRRHANGIPSVYVNDTSVFTENPKQTHLKTEIERLRTSLPEDKKSFVRKCVEDVTSKLDESKYNGNLSGNSWIQNDSGLNSIAKPKYVSSLKGGPTASSTPFKFVSSDLLNTSEQEPSPIQKRIEKLQMYGEPPPLSPLLPLNNLDKFKSKFRVPFKNTISK